MKMGFGTYNRNTGNLMSNSKDINCTDRFGYCSSAAWTNRSWAGGRVPDMSSKPPQKDTIVVPTGIVQFFHVLNAHMLFVSKSLNGRTYRFCFDKHVHVST
jgi:hypothetical protein